MAFFHSDSFSFLNCSSSNYVQKDRRSLDRVVNNLKLFMGKHDNKMVVVPKTMTENGYCDVHVLVNFLSVQNLFPLYLSFLAEI